MNRPLNAYVIFFYLCLKHTSYYHLSACLTQFKVNFPIFTQPLTKLFKDKTANQQKEDIDITALT